MIEYNKFYELTLTVAGIMFPVFQAILYFILEKSFDKLKYSKDLLIEYYKRYGQVISIVLLYLIIQPIVLLTEINIYKPVFYIFIILLLYTRLELLRYTGYTTTINSTQANPHKDGTLMKIIRYWENNTGWDKFLFCCFLFLFIFLPINSYYFDNLVSIDNNIIFISLLSSLVYGLFSIIYLVNRPIFIQSYFIKNNIYGQSNFKEEDKWNEEKIDSETKLIQSQLSAIDEFAFEKKRSPNKIFNYTCSYQISETKEIFIVILINNILIFDRIKIKIDIFEISAKLFRKLVKMNSEVGSFVLSYNMYIKDNYHNFFFRATRTELNSQESDNQKYIGNIKNIIIDELFV